MSDTYEKKLKQKVKENDIIKKEIADLSDIVKKSMDRATKISQEYFDPNSEITNNKYTRSKEHTTKVQSELTTLIEYMKEEYKRSKKIIDESQDELDKINNEPDYKKLKEDAFKNPTKAVEQDYNTTQKNP